MSMQAGLEASAAQWKALAIRLAKALGWVAIEGDEEIKLASANSILAGQLEKVARERDQLKNALHRKELAATRGEVFKELYLPHIKALASTNEDLRAKLRKAQDESAALKQAAKVNSPAGVFCREFVIGHLPDGEQTPGVQVVVPRRRKAA